MRLSSHSVIVGIISLLDFEGRKREIARIIGGTITEQNLKSAEEMLKI